MNKELKNLIRADLTRAFGPGKPPALYRLMNPSVRCTIAFRKAAFYSKSGNPLLSIPSRLRYLQLSQKFMFSIPYTTRIGEGFLVGHTGSVIINENAVLGRNVNIATGVVIGTTAGKNAGCPHIGDRVWIGSNAVIVGPVTVGEDVLIAPGTYVNFDVPPHSVVIGNPGVIHHKENATGDYIKNLI